MRRLTSVLGLLIVTAAWGISAQEQATLLKRDGSRVSGRFEAWNRNTNTLYLRLSLADQRVVPVGDVAVLEVAGSAEQLPDAEVEAARGGDHVLVLRSGEVLRGRLLNIEGGEGSGKEDEPRVLSFKPSAGPERRARFAEVRRLYFGNFPQSLRPSTPTPVPTPPAATEPDAPSGAIRVPANAQWVFTGHTVRRGERMRFVAEGQIQLSGDADDKASPAGSLKGRYEPRAHVSTLLGGALIGRIGNAPPFAIGDQQMFITVPSDGPLYLAVNDDPGGAGDNAGAFVVTVTVARGRR